jgi:hypothetical protein
MEFIGRLFGIELFRVKGQGRSMGNYDSVLHLLKRRFCGNTVNSLRHGELLKEFVSYERWQKSYFKRKEKTLIETL